MSINIPYFTSNTSTLSGPGLYGTSFNIVMISTLNILGKPYYDELKKNNVSFSNEIEDFLKQKIKILERNTKIDSILE